MGVGLSHVADERAVRPGRAFEEEGQVRGERHAIDLRHEYAKAVPLDEVVQPGRVGFGEGGGDVHQGLSVRGRWWLRFDTASRKGFVSGHAGRISPDHLPVRKTEEPMRVVYSAVKCFDPACGEPWRKFIAWSGLTQRREVLSLDGTLCPSIFRELTAEDWRHNAHEDCKATLFHDLDYVVRRVAGDDEVNVLALLQNPAEEEVRSFGDPASCSGATIWVKCMRHRFPAE